MKAELDQRYLETINVMFKEELARALNNKTKNHWTNVREKHFREHAKIKVATKEPTLFLSLMFCYHNQVQFPDWIQVKITILLGSK